MDYTIVHLRKPNSYNVVCGNGSAHARRTDLKDLVTCELCKDPKKLETHIEKIINWKKD